MRVQLIPTRPGETSALLHVDGAGGGAADVSLTGLGLAAGDLILAPAAGSFEDFGGVRLGSTVQGVFSLTNPGTQNSGPLTFQANRTEFQLIPSGGDPGDCVSGTTSLAPGQSCNLRVAFTPSERGAVESTLTGRSEGVGSVSLTLAGRGLLPGTLESSSLLLDFEGVVLGAGAQRSVNFQNRGDEPLTLAGTSLMATEGEGFSIQNSDCGAGRILGGGERCGVQLEFRPPRSDEEMTAELAADAVEGQQRLTVGLRGIGLDPGVLLIEPFGDGGADFGDVLLEGSQVRVFQVTNPREQTSGVLSFSASEGFEVVTPPESGECLEGGTSLGAGESCQLRVRFSPTRREVHQGLLTVSSALAGAQALALTGRGIIPAALELEPEINFGRVFTNTPTSRSLIVRNGGDEPLPPPGLELTSATDAQAMAFSYESACTQPLGLGEECEIAVRFAPTQAVPYSANLRLTSEPGGTAAVLLLAEALAPGSLVLAAAEGGSADFGDVAVGSSVTRAFTVTNPGSVPSGRLVIRTDSSRFQSEDGDCNQGDPAGLVDGASCTFSVQFSPDSSLEVVANLSVQSTGAGQQGLELRGRGRSPADLVATGNRDLGRAIIGQDGLTQPENQFTWTVNNQGDLASGVLTVSNDNPTEFERSNDSCSNASVPARSSCQMTLRFRPSTTGTRSARLAVTDPGSNRVVTLVLTGVGERLAALGESCINATCASGVCTRGVCCDRECDGTCQVCTGGVCVDQSNREQCGNGNGRCFGVDRCLLPEGQACGQGSDCGSGNCERRLNGQGLNDRLCCAGDCDLTGALCNAQGQCQQPTLAEGALCGRAGDLPCAGGLQCKACLDGAQRCTPPGACCGGCAPGYQCIGGSCGCPNGPNGQRMIDCGNGLCIQNRANACCPATPECSAARPNCDPADNLCKECVTANQCPGANRACNNGVCACAPGSRQCNDGRCIAGNQCCESCTGGRFCEASTGICRCRDGQQFVNGQCRLNLGAACTPNGTPCVSGLCVDGVCCESTCDGLCADCQAGTGRCVMPARDIDCQQITCAAPSSICQQAPAANATINNNNCLSLGQCKTAANCATPVAANNGAACDQGQDIDGCGEASCLLFRICNGGQCVLPTVRCAGQDRAVSPNGCCLLPFPVGEGPAEFFNTDPSFCAPGAFGQMTVTCDGQNDCPTGDVCCMTDAGNFNSIACRESCVDAIGTAFRVCASPGGGTSPCPGGVPCNLEHPDLPGWLFCQRP